MHLYGNVTKETISRQLNTSTFQANNGVQQRFQHDHGKESLNAIDEGVLVCNLGYLAKSNK